MLASQLIGLLAKVIEKHGDLPIKDVDQWHGKGIKITTIDNHPVVITDPKCTSIIFINLKG